jgi:NAD(P)-dependent dehydrogenase (short-subunit alcohol dehydrogenase family)
LIANGAVLVTGGSSGIGAALVAHFAEAGRQVVSVALEEAPPRAGVASLVVDLADPAATARVAAEIADRYAVSLFVHNAGSVRANRMEDTTADDLAQLGQLHLGAALTLAQAVIPGMKARRHGRIVLMSSRAAMGMATRTAYAATKAGMIGMARSWALELAPHGITVNLVAPGPIEGTEMFHEVLPKGDARIAALAANIPVQRLGRPQDVVNAVAFFASPQTDFVTGQLLYVCGGLSLGAAG